MSALDAGVVSSFELEKATIPEAARPSDPFQLFRQELGEKFPVVEYKWTAEKKKSCKWVIDRVEENQKGLDVGGTEWLCNELTKKGVDITCFDFVKPPGYDKFVQGDMFDVAKSFKEQTFDFIVTRHTLEHSICPLFQLWSFKRLLKDDGRLFVIVPMPDSGWVWFPSHFSPLSHEHWMMLFWRAGFRVDEADAGSWAPAKRRFIEFRYALTVEDRAMRLDGKNRMA